MLIAFVVSSKKPTPGRRMGGLSAAIYASNIIPYDVMKLLGN